MRVALLGPVSPIKGGISYYTTELCRRLGSKHDVTVFSLERLYTSFLYHLFFKGQNIPDKSTQQVETGVATMRTISVNPLSWLACGLKIRRMQPDVLLFVWFQTYLFPLASIVRFFLPKKTKLVFVCHMPHEFDGSSRFATRHGFSRADGFLTHSARDTQLVRDMASGAKCVQAYLPVYTLKSKKTAVKKELGLGKNVLLFFGFVRWFKGLQYLLKALPIVREKVDADVLIVGEFWEDKQRFVNLIDELGIKEHVKMVDNYVPNEDIGKYFACADAAVLPYEYVTQSAVAQVAYAHDTPIIGSTVLAESVSDGKTGMLVAPKDERALAYAIIDFYKKKKRGVFVKNIQSIKKGFGWDEYLGMVESLFPR